VEAAWQQSGVLGARMVGAGFGGCAIAIVDKDQVDDFQENVGKIYQDKIGYAADFYIAEISDGPKEIEVEK
jgi:Galactokinase